MFLFFLSGTKMTLRSSKSQKDDSFTPKSNDAWMLLLLCPMMLKNRKWLNEAEYMWWTCDGNRSLKWTYSSRPTGHDAALRQHLIVRLIWYNLYLTVFIPFKLYDKLCPECCESQITFLVYLWLHSSRLEAKVQLNGRNVCIKATESKLC